MSLLEPPQNVLGILHKSLDEVPFLLSSSNGNETTTTSNNGNTTRIRDGSEEIMSYVTFLAAALAEAKEFDASVWKDTFEPYVSTLLQIMKQKRQNQNNNNNNTNGEEPALQEEKNSTGIVIEAFRIATEQAYTKHDNDTNMDHGDDDEEELCDLKFNLAYGGKILLHQTRLRLCRGHRYALVGQNGVGKTTLMNAIDTGKIDGWPSHLRTTYVESGSNVDPTYQSQHVLPYLIESTKRTEEDCIEKLQELEFTNAMMKGTIRELSGGWQMKLRLVRAVLINPDIYLLDEPTNHLSESAVQWLTHYLQGLHHQTVLCVSHDTNFLENIGTDVIHYEQQKSFGPYRKLVPYKGTMSEFHRQQPQAKSYFRGMSTRDGKTTTLLNSHGEQQEEDDDFLKFDFPDPGRLDGIKTATQKFIEMDKVDFKYPGSETNTLNQVSLKMSLSSRVVVLGANGAGKTTLIKMIVGETLPTNLGQCKFYIHPNVRVAYVAQHAFYHVEQHMDESPVAYIQWRFKDGFDKEKLESEGYKITEEEQKAIDDFQLEGIWSRRLRAGTLEYEVKKKNIPEKDNKYYSRDELLAMGFEHLLKQTDEKIASKEAGLDLRPVTTTEIQKHLDGFSLPQEFGTYGKIRGLSGGQKVKLVLAAAFWTVPHLVVMDEPTNFLDRDALGALSKALNEWGGAVLMISHSKEFYSSVCKEEWIVEDGRVNIQGMSIEREMKAVARKKKYDKELDGEQLLEKAGGNLNSNADKYKDATTNFWGQTVSKKEARQYDKAKKKGDVALMRKVLQIPVGKIMPGYEELGDGK